MKQTNSILFIAFLFLSQIAFSNDSTSVSLKTLEAPEDLAFFPGGVNNRNYQGVLSHVNWNGIRTEEEFRTPLHFTIGAEKRLNKGENRRFTAGAGLGLIVLKSQLKYQDSWSQTTINTTRNYLTIPLYLKYDFVMEDKLQLYSKFGISTEIGLGGKSTTETNYGGSLSGPSTERFSLGEVQLNANLGVGLNVKISKHFNLFSEVSAASYLFQDRLIDVWASKPVWMNIKTGISVQL